MIISAAQGVPGWAAGLLIITGVVVHTVGELLHFAAGFELSFALAEAVGPGLVIALCVSWGRAGWIVLGGILAATGMLAPWVVGEREKGAGKFAWRGAERRGENSGAVQGTRNSGAG
ncbi:hypothetical protein IAG44_08260 [Streptomyces roseirectus]|uniref:Uncharacterized protein n=1 Tax=Streptomyces roseirectus TaxID=2768066 RepID=A0A7H0I9G7_9ACTN|nr:hypothetical protein [Streptomyces roseirectus]QNP69433.1 hypothetical protein IAG44_08260 [Streptomyces roseirectus]